MRAALVAAIVTQIAIITAVLLLRKPPPPVVHSATSIPITVTIPITVQAAPVSTTAPVPVTARPSCPPPRTDAPPAKDASTADGVTQVFASRTNAGWIAAWNDDGILVSTDAGKTFESVVGGTGVVRDVTFDCFGNVIALRDDELRIREGDNERWLELPPGLSRDAANPPKLIGGGPDVIVIGLAAGDSAQPRLAVSPDRGTTWWYRDLDSYWEIAHVTGFQAADGSIEVALTIADCMHDEAYWFRIRDGKVQRDELGVALGPVVFDRGRAYIVPEDGDRHVEWKRFGEADWHHATDETRLRRIADGSVDAAGRVWSVTETRHDGSWASVEDR